MAEEGGVAAGGDSVPRLSSGSRLRNRPDLFLITCKCFSFLTALVALLCVAVNVISAIRSFKNGSDIFNGILRCYAVVIACIVVVAETEWGFITKFWKVLEYWAGRGMLQIFVAVMTRAFADSTSPKYLTLLQNIASYLLLGCGFLYVLLGILCFGFLKRARQKKAEITREQAVNDLEELERRREELEQLLLAERV